MPLLLSGSITTRKTGASSMWLVRGNTEMLFNSLRYLAGLRFAEVGFFHNHLSHLRWSPHRPASSFPPLCICGRFNPIHYFSFIGDIRGNIARLPLTL